MKVSGGTAPITGTVQRDRASKPIVALLEICTRGWYSEGRLLFAGMRHGSFCGKWVDRGMLVSWNDSAVVCRTSPFNRTKDSIFHEFGRILINAI